MTNLEGQITADYYPLARYGENQSFINFLKKEIRVVSAADLVKVKEEAEQIGHVLIHEPYESKKANKPLAELKEPELLDISKNIYVNGSNLFEIYRNKLISEKGLRRLVSEYQKGNDISEKLRSEIMEHDIDYERDPILRDMAIKPQASEADSDLSYSDFIKKAESYLSASSDNIEVSKTAPSTEINNQPAVSYKPFSLASFSIADGVFVSIISALILAIILIYLTKSA